MVPENYDIKETFSSAYIPYHTNSSLIELGPTKGVTKEPNSTYAILS